MGLQDELLDKINNLANLLISLQSEGYAGACWGYNFDWKSKAFYLPNQTPTIVATSFAAESLVKAYANTGSEIYLKIASSSVNFIIEDLNRIPKQKGFMFSYSPLDHQAVYNATLLGTKTLSLIYYFTKTEELKHLAFQSARQYVTCKMKTALFLTVTRWGTVGGTIFTLPLSLKVWRTIRSIAQMVHLWQTLKRDINIGWRIFLKNKRV